MNNKIIFVDTETGGLDPRNHGLLQIGLVKWVDGEIVDKKLIKVKQETYNLTAGAQKIHGIDIVEHEKDAMYYNDVPFEILDFLDSKEKEIIGGHNVDFDAKFLKELYKDSILDFNNQFSFRYLDTASILKYLYHAGIVDKKLSSLNDGLKYFGLYKERTDDKHNALNDAILTAKLYNKLLELNKKRVIIKKDSIEVINGSTEITAGGDFIELVTIADILSNKQTGKYELVEPACPKDAPAYKPFKSSTIIVKNSTSDPNHTTAIMWEIPPTRHPLYRSGDIVHLARMVINSKWKKIE